MIAWPIAAVSSFYHHALRTPRPFAIDPSGRWLIAANQDSGTVVVFRLEALDKVQIVVV